MSSTLSRTAVALAGGLLASLGAFGAAADCCSGEAPHVRHMIQDADLVFAGEVAHIEYALSLPTGPEGRQMPYTFVTYRVDEVVRGKDPGHFLTLRFLGGYHEGSGLYLRPSNAPQFDLGDQDILFVKGNTEAHVPLVGHSMNGRLRMIGGQVYSELGEAMHLSEDGVLRRGSRYVLEEVATTHVAGEIMIDNLGPEALTERSDAIEADDLLDELKDMGREFGRRPKTIVAQADSSAPFEGPDMTPVAPPADELAVEAALEAQDAEDIGLEGDDS